MLILRRALGQRLMTGFLRMLRLLPMALVVVATCSSAAWAGGRADAAGPAAPAVSGNSGGAASSQGGSGVTLDPHVLPLPSTGQRGVQVRSNMYSGGGVQAGATVDYWPGQPHPEAPRVANGQDDPKPVELGGFVGYLFHDERADVPASSLGLDLQVATDPQGTTGGWLIQPGIDYTTPLGAAFQLNTRLFSTYGSEGYSSGPFGPERSSSLRPTGNSEAGMQDVGIGLGLGYSFGENWNIQTQARYQRSLTTPDPEAAKEVSPHNFFGGVMLDYKF